MTSSNIVRITRTARFCAAHRYHSDQLSEAENRKVFGKCNRKHGHGHNYRVDVAVEGPVDPVTGMVMNLAELDAMLGEHLIEPLDHSFLNLDIAHFESVVPTCENLALYIAEVLAEELVVGQFRLASIRVWESDDLYVELDLPDARSVAGS